MLSVIGWAELFDKIIGKQTLLDNVKYRLLNFCIHVNYNGDSLLYNNLTKELLLLNNCESDMVKNKNFDPNNEFIKYLIEHWFLVSVTNDDINLSKQCLQFAKQISFDDSITTYDILTTTGCNARCFYCFEAGTRVVSMTEQTAISVSQFILQKSKNKKISIKWFGGEPLCNTKAINLISQELMENNINFSSSMTTNGYLFNNENIKLAKQLWKMKYVQITLDGMEETYNRVKNYVNNDQNAFKKVIENIATLLENNIAVIVRLNMDFYNETELYSLIDYLNKLYGKNDLFSVYVSLIFEDVGFKKIKRNKREKSEITERFFKLRKYLCDLGLLKPRFLKNEIKISHCMADSINSVLISPEGKLGYCEHNIDNDFYGDVLDEGKRIPWNEYTEPNIRCYTCAAYPICLNLKKCQSAICEEYKQLQILDDLERAIVYTFISKK